MPTMLDERGRPLDPTAIIEHTYGSMTVAGKPPYPGALPADLAPWYAYIADSGHCVVILPAGLSGPEHPPLSMLCAAPIRSVLRAGHEIRDGWPVVDLPYDPDLGLVCPDGDEEW